MDGPVAVVGMGLAVPGASSPDQFWALLNSGKPVFTEPGQRFAVDAFYDDDHDAEDRGYTRVSGYWDGAGAHIDPHPRVAEEVETGQLEPDGHSVKWLRHSLAQALDGVTRHDNDTYALYVGGSVVGSQQGDEAVLVEMVARAVADRRGEACPDRIRETLRRHYRMAGRRSRTALPDQMVRAAAKDMLPETYEFGVVDAACSSTLYAIDLGAKSLLAGDSSIACCGGYFSNSPRNNVLFSKLNGLSATGDVRVFDDAADGTLFSDATSMLVLKRLDRAVADGDHVWGVLGGFGGSSDGAGKSIFAPNPVGQRLCLDRAHAAAGITVGDIDWVLAHGTGTPAGDAVELTVLEELTSAAEACLCTSSKSVVGHGAWSAGGISMAHALLALRHGMIPAQHRFDSSKHQQRVRIRTRPVMFSEREDRPRVVGVSAFGFGGVNAHMVVQDRVDQSSRSDNAVTRDAIVAVAWTAHLPGDPDADETLEILTGDAAGARVFGSYPLPSFAESKLPRKTLQAIDRGQHMALRVAARFVADHGELWAPVRATTGVLAAQTGPPRLFMDNLVRCYTHDLTEALGDHDAAAMRMFRDEVTETTPPSSSATLAGMLPNVLAARLANRYDLHGLTLHVDTGQGSGLTAVHAASRYLRCSELDLALLVGVSANSGPAVEAVAAVDAGRIAEGAFLLALARESTARAHRWKPLGRVHSATSAPESGGRVVTLGSHRHTYLGADGVAAVITALHAPGRQVTIAPPAGELGAWITVHPCPQEGSP